MTMIKELFVWQKLVNQTNALTTLIAMAGRGRASSRLSIVTALFNLLIVFYSSVLGQLFYQLQSLGFPFPE